MRWLRRSVRAALAASLTLLLAAALLPHVRLADPAVGAVRGDGVAAAEVALDLACGDAVTVMQVAAVVEPAEVVDGGTVTVQWRLTLAGEGRPPSGALAVSTPLPAAAAVVHDVDVVGGAGVLDTGWSVAGGRLRVDLTLVDGAGDVGATVVAPVDLTPGLAPTTVSFAAPDSLTLVGVAPAGGDLACAPLEPVTSLVGVVVSQATVPTTSPTTTPPTTSPTTTPPTSTPPTTDPTRPPTTPPDPAAGGDAPTATPPVLDDLRPVPTAPGASSRVVTGDTTGARARLDATRQELARVADRLAALERRSASLERRRRHLADERRLMADKVHDRAEDLDALVVATYVAAVDVEVTPEVPDTRSVPLATALDHARSEYDRLLGREGEVMDALAEVSADRAESLRDLDRAQARERDLQAQLGDGRRQLTTFRLGGELAVTGFHFPVAGPHDFSDTWHAPRSGGRLHEGTDVFAAEGTPLRAVERGVLAGVGTGELGGIKLWLVGESGTQYYYAHLQGYARGVADGVLVDAGEVIGFVGHTGNAATTPPHLHFEVHPEGGDPINGYPLLAAAADGVRPPVVSATATAAPSAAEPTPTSPPAPTTSSTTAATDATTTATTAAGAPAVAPGRSVAAERPDVAAAWGDDGQVAEGLRVPRGVAVAADGRVFVADTARDRVLVLTPGGTPLATWGSSGSAAGRFHEPQGVAVAADGTVYVADTGNGRVQHLTADGEALDSWDGSGTPEGRMNAPTGVAVDARGRVYVVDSLNDRVRVVTAEGEPVRSWGGFGDEPGRFADPTGVAVGPDGDVYVADTYNARVQRFTPRGRFVAEWTDGLRRPAAVTVTAAGDVLVADRRSGTIRQFDADGSQRQAWGDRIVGTGERPTGLDHPAALVLDGRGRLLLADTGHGRVLAFRWR